MTFQTKLSNWWNKQHPAAKWYYKVQGGALLFFAIAGGIVITVDTVTGGMLEANRQRNLATLGITSEKTEQVETHTWRESLEEETNETNELDELGQTQEEETLSVVVKPSSIREQHQQQQVEKEELRKICLYSWNNAKYENPYLNYRLYVDQQQRVFSIHDGGKRIGLDENEKPGLLCRFTYEGEMNKVTSHNINGDVVEREWTYEGDKLVKYSRLESGKVNRFQFPLIGTTWQ